MQLDFIKGKVSTKFKEMIGEESAAEIIKGVKFTSENGLIQDVVISKQGRLTIAMMQTNAQGRNSIKFIKQEDDEQAGI